MDIKDFQDLLEAIPVNFGHKVVVEIDGEARQVKDVRFEEIEDLDENIFKAIVIKV